jgi:hypothetical protein
MGFSIKRVSETVSPGEDSSIPVADQKDEDAFRETAALLSSCKLFFTHHEMKIFLVELRTCPINRCFTCRG